MDLDLRVTQQQASDLQAEIYAATGHLWPMSKSDLDQVEDGLDIWLLGSMPVGLLLDQQNRAPGKWGDKNGNPVWIANPIPSKPVPALATGVPLAKPGPGQTADLFSGAVTTNDPTSITSLVANAEHALGLLKAALAAKGVL